MHKRLTTAQTSLVMAALSLASERWAAIAEEGRKANSALADTLARQGADAADLRALFSEAELVTINTDVDGNNGETVSFDAARYPDA